MQNRLVVLGSLVVSACVGETLELTGETERAVEALTVEVAVSPSRWGSSPQYVVLGTGLDARVQTLDASGTTVFERPGVTPFVVTVAVSPGRQWTKFGVREEHVAFVDLTPQWTDGPSHIRGRLLGVPAGDEIFMMVIHDGQSDYVTNLKVEPDGTFTAEYSREITGAALLVATVLDEREPLAHAMGVLDLDTYRADLAFDHVVSRAVDLVVDGASEGLTGAVVRAGFGVDDLVRYTDYIPEGFDYRSVPRIPVPEAAYASFETFVALDGLPPRRRQSGQWPVQADGRAEALALLPLPTLGLEVGSFASSVAYDQVPRIEYALPADTEGTIVIAEALEMEKLFEERCRSLEWRIDLDPRAGAVELPEFPSVPGLRRLPRGVPLTVDLEARRGALTAATSGTVVFGGAPGCEAVLPDWAVGSFVANPAEGCGSGRSRITVSACGEYRSVSDIGGVIIHDCAYLENDPGSDTLVFRSLIGPGGTRELDPADVAFDMSISERGPFLAKVGSAAAASIPPALVGRWVVDRVSSTVVEAPADTPIAGSYLPDESTSDFGLFEIDHRGQLTVSAWESLALGSITSWSNGSGTVRYVDHAGMCSSVDRGATLSMIDDENLVLVRVERQPDYDDRDRDGSRTDIVAFERRLFLRPFIP